MKHLYFNDQKFTRDDKTGYYQHSKTRQRMHRYVWEFYNGEIPEGFDIHHLNGDKANNSIENLRMIPRSEHMSFHVQERLEKDKEPFSKRMKHALKFACEWHKSAEGKDWHKKHFEEMKDKLLAEKEFICSFCGKKFSARHNGHTLFCSNACKSAYRRKSGVDDEIRVCFVCGEKFKVNKYKKTKTCGAKCAQKIKR